MKYFNKMLTSLLVQNDFISNDERFDVELDLQKSFEQYEKNTSFAFVSTFFKSPIGVIFTLIMYAFAIRQFNKIKSDMDDDILKEEFKKEMSRNIMKDLLK